MDFKRLSDYQDYLTTSRVPGNDAAVSLDGKCIYRFMSGYSDLETKKPMDGNETYFLYSGTKLITSALGMRLWEEGRLRMDYPLSFYIPEFDDIYIRRTVNGNCETVPAKDKILVSHLFNMTAGYDYIMNVPEIHEARKKTEGHCNTLDVVRSMAQIPLNFEPGTAFLYSICHDILAGVIEVITDKKLRDYAEEVLFEPLGMESTSYGFRKDGQKDRMASQYLYREDLQKPVPMRKENLFILGDEYDSGGAGIITSLDDYFKFATMIACGGTSDSGYRFLSPETIDFWRKDTLNDIQREQFENDWSKGYSYANGVQTRISKPGEICDFGWGGAAGMKVFISTEERIAFVYFMHMLNMPDVHSFENELRNNAFFTFEH